MKTITTRFVTSNIISSIVLISSIPLLKTQNKELFNNENALLGLLVFVVLAAGQYASIYKAKVIVTNSVGSSLNRFEKVFLGIVFFFSITSLIMTMMSFIMIFGKPEDASSVVKVGTVLLAVVGFVLLIVEAMIVFRNIDIKPKQENKTINVLYYLYVSTGIAIGWDMLLIGSKVGLRWGRADFFSELIATIVLAFMLFFPFQRLLWYEIMSESKGRKDNLKVFGSVLLVLSCAIIPLFFN